MVRFVVVAGAQRSSPDWMAMSRQSFKSPVIPGTPFTVNVVTVADSTVQTAGVVELTFTGSPEVAVAVMVADPRSATEDGAVNKIDCAALAPLCGVLIPLIDREVVVEEGSQ